MRYRELLEKEQKIREEIGHDKYNLASLILDRCNGKLSSSEALEIVSKLSEKEENILLKIFINAFFNDLCNEETKNIQIVNNPRVMAQYLVEERKVYEEDDLRPRSCKLGKHTELKVLLGECEVPKIENVYSSNGVCKQSNYIGECKKCDFEVDNKLVVLVTTVPDYSKTFYISKCSIYIYIPHGEYI